MRLAFLADASLPHTRRWVNFFSSKRHECLLLSLERGTGYSCPVEFLPPYTMLPRFLRYTLNIKRVGARLAEFRPDLVNAHFLPNYGWVAARCHTPPFVLTVLGSDILTVPAHSPMHAWRTRYVLSRADAVIADAAMLAQAVCRFGYGSERILTVPLGIELERFGIAALDETSWLRERHAAPDTGIIVLSTRRLEPIYDVGTVIDACARLDPHARLQLRLAGTGSQHAALHRRAGARPVVFLGWLATEQLDAELRAAHIYVSTSKSDSTSVSLLEAMAAGAFPVVTDIAGNREWIRDRHNGLLFTVGDVAGLARCLEHASTNPALRVTAAHQNRRIIAERASWTRNMSDVEQLFERLAQAP